MVNIWTVFRHPLVNLFLLTTTITLTTLNLTTLTTATSPPPQVARLGLNQLVELGITLVGHQKKINNSIQVGKDHLIT